MRIVIVLTIVLSACASPTSPTPPQVTPPPVSVTPSPPAAPTPNPLLTDPRFNLDFYRQFVLNGYEHPSALQPLRRQEQAPAIYLFTIDEAGAAIDARTLEATAAALIDVTGKLTGVFGLSSLTRGIGPAPMGTIAVLWSASGERSCGSAVVGGRQVRLSPKTAGCRCPGHPSAINPLVVKHEMGHILGFHHTDSVTDLMHAGGHTVCDMPPSEREQFHARVAYGQAIGSLDPK